MSDGMKISWLLTGLIALNLVVWGLVFLRWQRRRRIWVAAFLEQGRVDHDHHTKFRTDQKVNAIQQRLARKLGKRYAYSAKTRKRVLAEVVRADGEGWD